MDHTVPHHIKVTIQAFQISRLPVQAIQYVVSRRYLRIALMATAGVGIYSIWKAGTLHEKFYQPGSCRKKPSPLLDFVFYKRLKSLLQIAVPTLRSRIALYALLLPVLAAIRAYLYTNIAVLTGQNAKYIISGDFVRFANGILKTFAVSVPTVLLGSIMNHLTSSLHIHVTKRLVQHCNSLYFSSNSSILLAASPHYNIANCGARIMRDSEKFSLHLTLVFSEILRSGLEFAIITNRLAACLGMQGPIYLYFYYAVSGCVVRMLVPSINQRLKQHFEMEGQINAAYENIATHAMEVTAYGAVSVERDIIESLTSNYYRKRQISAIVQAIVQMIDRWLGLHGSQLCGYVLIGAKVFGGLYKNRLLFGYSKTEKVLMIRRVCHLVTTLQLVNHVVSMSDKMIQTYKKTFGLCQSTANLTDLIERLDLMKSAVNEGSERNIIRGDTIKFENITVVSTNGHVLVENISVEILPGKNLLIVGPAGSGKSAFFSVLIGAWPVHSGRIYRPAIREYFYIPPIPYTFSGTLLDQIIYPHTEADLAKGGRSFQELEAILELVGLQYLKRGSLGWKTVQNWGETLSQSEKLRVAFARLFYSRPKYVIVDEFSGSFSMEFEDLLYRTMIANGITIISVHAVPRAIWKYHSHILHYNQNSRQWVISNNLPDVWIATTSKLGNGEITGPLVTAEDTGSSGAPKEATGSAPASPPSSDSDEESSEEEQKEENDEEDEEED